MNAVWVWGSRAVFFLCLLSALGIVRFTIYCSLGGQVTWAEQVNMRSSELKALPEFRAAGTPPLSGLSPPTSWPHKGAEEETRLNGFLCPPRLSRFDNRLRKLKIRA